MIRKEMTEILGALLVLLLGAGYLYYASFFRVGALTRMGPGYFPMIIGAALVGCGVVLLLRAWRDAGEAIIVEWRPFIFVSGSMVVFALLIGLLGLFPATMFAAFLAAFGGRSLSFLGAFTLAAAIATLVVLIFSLGLGLSVPIFGAR